MTAETDTASPDINSRDWWERYFGEHWEANRGSQQTRHFMERLLASLPLRELSFLRRRELRVLDWGCAFGQGVALLAQVLPNARVEGLDVSATAIATARQNYPALTFVHAPDGDIPEDSDVVITSNRLEHFERPLEVVAAHLSHCRQLYLALVPYNEEPRIEQHRCRFDEASFPERIGRFERLFARRIDVDPLFWRGQQLLVAYGSPDYKPDPGWSVPTQSEQQKWDSYYADREPVDDDEATARFNAEFVEAVAALLPGGGQTLEAGCGGGGQSLALAQTGRFEVSLMDFSARALAYARQRYARRQAPADFIEGDVLEPGQPAYDLVFNAGVLEHYSFDEQVSFLRGMASRSRRYVLVLVPNRFCYWYWLWRVQQASQGQWPYGKEVPWADLSDAFRAAGLTVLGQAFMGQAWTESFIGGLAGLDESLRQQLYEIHRSPLIPASQKSYLLAMLGSVTPEAPELPRRWAAPQPEPRELAEMQAALADWFALRLADLNRLSRLEAQVIQLQAAEQDQRARLASSEQARQTMEAELATRADALQALSAKVAERNQALQAARASLAEQNDRASVLAEQVAEHKKRASALAEQVAGQDKVAQAAQAQLQNRELQVRSLELQITKIHSSRLWRLAGYYWRLRYWFGRRIDVLGLRSKVGPLLPKPVKRALRRVLVKDGSANSPAASEETWLTSRKEPAAPLEYYAVLCLPIIEWQARFQRPQQLAAQLAAHGHPVFYLDPGSFVGGVAPGSGVQPVVETLGDQLYLVRAGTSKQLSIYADILDGPDLDCLTQAVTAIQERYGLGQAICLVQLPFWAPLARRLRDALGWKIVYDCMDDHGGFSTNSHAMLEGEQRLIRESDLTIATSQALKTKVEALTGKCLLVPNATDFEHFSNAPAERPLRALPHPIIGYYGAISDWFDMGLIRLAAQAHPDWSFVLIGNTFGADGHRDLAGLPNVHFLGEQPYSALPGFLQSFDVCCIPFKLNRLTQATNPVKFFEFISAGKPVVSVRLPELLPYVPEVYLADDGPDFVRQLERALAEDNAQRRAARVALARRNTWAVRQAAVHQAVTDLFPRVSVVVVTWNNLALTQQTVSSLLMYTLYPNWELILVDNASEDDTPDYLRRTAAQYGERVKIILNPENTGFAHANNQGVAAASGAYVVFLNNDVVVSDGWLAALLRHARRPGVGAVGPVTNYCGNEARIAVPYAGLGEMQTFARERRRLFAGRYFEMDMLALFCFCIERSKLDQAGPLDERFGIGMFEDDDLCFRLRQLGYSLICAEDVFVHHVGNASFKRLDHEAYHELWNRNKRLFEEKWQMPWLPARGRGELSAEQRLLEILAAYPERRGVLLFPPTVDWGYMFQRPQQLAQALARQGYLVFYCTTNYNVDHIDGFVRMAERLYVCRVPFEVFQPVRDLTVFILWPMNRSYLKQLSARPTVVYEMLDDLNVFPKVDEQVRRDHAAMLREADLVTVTARRLLDGVRAVRGDALLCPNAVDLPAFLNATERAKNNPPADLLPVLARGAPIIGYYGALSAWVDYALIRQAAQLRPEYQFVLVGPDHDGTFQRSGLTELPNVTWLGAKLYAQLPYYLGHFDVATIPFVVNELTHSVSPIKLFEYLAAGKPVVATAMAECKQYPEVLIAEDAASFAQLLATALEQAKDPARRAALVALARANSWDARAEMLSQALRDRQTHGAQAVPSGTGR